jgi:hypothetical protein
MPREADIIRDNVKLGLHHARMYEQKSLPSETTMGRKERKLNDGNYTIAYLLKTGAIPKDEQTSFEQYMTRIQEMDIKYATFIAQWPFLVAQRLLKMQSSRLRVIKAALAEKLNNHPLITNNVAGFNNSNANLGINNGNNPLSADLTTALYRGGLHTLPASVTAGMNHVGDPAGFYNPNANTGVDIHIIAGHNNPQGDYMSAGVDLAMFQRGGAEDQQSQSAIRPGQDDLGGRGQ